MTRILFTIFLSFLAASLFAQKIEQGFDHFFKPTEYAPRYYVITEKQDTLWHREAYYLPERGMYMEGWYKDKDCKIEHGKFTWYYSNKILRSTGTYIDGKKEGTWLTFNEEGHMTDSATYTAGKLKGTRLCWHKNGMLADSMQFDGAGNGVEVSWFDDGNIASAGYWVSDTTKKGKWQYFHRNGKIKAEEAYISGNRVSFKCFDAMGNQLDSVACQDKEAEFPGGLPAWAKFLQRNLNHNAPIQNRAPSGQYSVVVQFIVDIDGSISDIKPVTKFGYGMEEEVVRVIKKGPKWIPAEQFGIKVKAYRKQPITFVVSGR